MPLPRPTQKILAAAAYLSTPVLSFLPGLALWCWAKDRDPWLQAHGRSAALVNFTIFAGYLVLVPFVHLGDLVAIAAYVYAILSGLSATPHRLPAGVGAPHGILAAVLGPHYLAEAACVAATTFFLALWLGALAFNLFSTWRVSNGLGPWSRRGEGEKRKAAGDGCGVTAAWESRAGGRRRVGGGAIESVPQRDHTAGGEVEPRAAKSWIAKEHVTGVPPAVAGAIAKQKPGTHNQRLLPSLSALVIYLAAAAIELLLPIRFDVRHILIANSAAADPSIFLWSLVWWPWAIGHGLNPFYTHFIWTPVGQNLLWIPSIPSLALLLAPVTHFFGPIVSYNLIALLSPVLGAWAAYLLCRHVTGQLWSSLFGGWIFGFSTYEFAHLQLHMNLFMTLALPLAVWIYLLRRDGRLSRRWYVGLLALLAIFQFGVSTEILASVVPLGLLATLFAALLQKPDAASSDRRPGTRTKGRPYLWSLGSLVTGHGSPRGGRWSLFLETLAGLTIAGVVLLPCFYYVFCVNYAQGLLATPGVCSADPLNFFIPTVTTWFGGSWAAPLTLHFNAPWRWELGAYLGAPLIIILALFIREFSAKPRGRFLILSLATTALLSLGPQLQTLRHATFIVLPWYLPAHMPLFDLVQPLRLVVYLWLAAAVSAAWWLAESKVRRFWRPVLTGLSVVFLLPNISAGYWTYKPPNPRFFTTGATARYLPRGANVVVLPYGETGYSMLWQAEAHFSFSMAGAYVNPTVIPHCFSASPVVAAFYRGHANGPRYPAELRQFIKTFKIQAFIIVDRDHRNSFSSLVAPLHIQPIHTGGVWLYLLPTTTAGQNRNTRAPIEKKG